MPLSVATVANRQAGFVGPCAQADFTLLTRTSVCWQTIKGLAGVLQQYRELGEQHTRLQTQVGILSQQNAASLERVVAKYGDEVYDTTLEQLEEYSGSIETTFAEQQTSLHNVLQEIRVSELGAESQPGAFMQSESEREAPAPGL